MPSDPDAAGRADLSGHVVFTIDDASTRDIDDGLSAEFLPDGRVRLWVHIADPTRYIALGSPLELEARHRTRTLYMPHGEACLMLGSAGWEISLAELHMSIAGPMLASNAHSKCALLRVCMHAWGSAASSTDLDTHSGCAPLQMSGARAAFTLA